MGFNWKSIVGTVAPGLATALGGPLAGMAVKAISTAILGKSDGSEAEVTAALAAGGPELLQKLREADQNFQVEMKKLDIDLEKIAADDRGSARAREIATKDYTPRVIAFSSFIGFFGILSLFIFREIPATTKDTLMIMIGVLGGIVTSITAYYFGSSAGSAKKSNQIDDLVNKL